MGNELATQPQNGTQIAKQSVIGEQQIVRVAETASQAVAAEARAQIEARYAMALQRPRDWENVRAKLMLECKRPGFAQTAWYSKPVGGQAIQGLSIRFAEAAMRHIGNLLPAITVIYDDDKTRIIRVGLSDLEANLYFVKDVSIQKTVERRKIGKGQQPISTRINSFGDTVYLVPATDDDLLNKENAQASKALRNHVLRLLPGDITDECRELILETLNNQAAVDPAAERKKLSDAFAAINVMPSDLKLYLGHELAQVSASEIVDLRAVYTAIKTGETSWFDVMEQRGAEKAEAAPTDAPPKSTADLKAKEKAKKAALCSECGSSGAHVSGCPNEVQS